MTNWGEWEGPEFVWAAEMAARDLGGGEQLADRIMVAAENLNWWGFKYTGEGLVERLTEIAQGLLGDVR